MSTSRHIPWIMSLAVAALVAPLTSQAAPPPAMRGSLQMEIDRTAQRYEAAALPAVQNMLFPRLYDWAALDGSTLVVWTADDSPWLVRLDRNCPQLEGTDAVVMTSRNRVIHQDSDFVQVGNEECDIASIHPVDYAMVADVHYPRVRQDAPIRMEVVAAR